MRQLAIALLLLSLANLTACRGSQPQPPVPSAVTGLAINEIVTNNEGVYVDEQGELDDWVEIVNISNGPIRLSDFTLNDSGSAPVALPELVLQPDSTIVLWTDDSPDQGPTHLPFKLSSSGDTLELRNSTGAVVDRVEVPALADNQAYGRFPSGSGAFQVCRYTSPRRANGDACQSATAPTVGDTIHFHPFDATQWPASVVPRGLALNEVALLPDAFIEVRNFSTEPLDLSEYSFSIAPLFPTSGAPAWDEQPRFSLADLLLEPGAVSTAEPPVSAVQAVLQQPLNEGVVVLYHNPTRAIVDQVPFMHWPGEAALARAGTAPFAFRFCHNATADQAGACEPLAARPLGNRSRGLYTPADFATLASGSGLANIESVKFVVDLARGNAVHYLSAERWPLHYTFVREVIDGLAPLNRCDPQENLQFENGWGVFSQQHYYSSQTRRYHLGTLSRHSNAGLHAVEYTFGDAITAEQMREAFYLSTSRTPDPLQWALRPQDAQQVDRVRAIEGQLPLVGPNAPFQNLTQQTLAPGIAFGTLQFVETAELPSALLGPRVIVITHDVPNDIDFVGGLITETFQTPLAHVNILSQGRGTPNLALPDARQHPEVAPLVGKLVRFEVTAGGYSLREASASEAEAFWASQSHSPEPLVPRLDRATAALIDLADVGFEALPSIGAKAAQLAEVMRINGAASACPEGAEFAVPEQPFAIPMRHYLEHFAASGAEAYLAIATGEPLFASDLDYRRLVLASVRQMILDHPLAPALLSEVRAEVQQRFGNARVRFRSSSNTEDLSTFNGAGLYDSVSAELDDDELTSERAIRTVWASLWNARAFEERSYANVDQSQVAMAVLVHRAFRNERANGVAIARNILNPTRTDQYYINSQAGEASVANPAPGVITEQLVYQWPPRTPRLTFHSHSSLTDGPILQPNEVRALACVMSAVQTHFKELLDPRDENRWLTLETEFKLLGAERELLIKQARPYPLGRLSVPNDCREF